MLIVEGQSSFMPLCAKSWLVEVVPAETEKAVITAHARPLRWRHWASGEGSVVDAESEEGVKGLLGWEGTTR